MSNSLALSPVILSSSHIPLYLITMYLVTESTHLNIALQLLVF